MSFDVYFQRYRHRDTEPGGGEAMRQVLAPYIVREEPDRSFALVKYGDGTADIYLSGAAMMATTSLVGSRGTCSSEERAQPGG